MPNKIIVKMKDGDVNHEPSYIQDTSSISFIRNLSPNSDGDVDVVEGDIVIYTNRFQKRVDPKAKKNIALMMEGQEINRRYYEYIGKNNDKFDIVLTFDKKLLDRGENFKLNLCGTCWMHDAYIRLWDKSKCCSMITSKRNATSGHKFRHIITHFLEQNSIPVDIYGGKYTHLPYMTTKAFAPDHTGRHITNGKINALKDYMFSITIENSKHDYMFTEKLIDCFLTGTIPIYYGCPSIGRFFDVKGIIVIDTLEDLANVMPILHSNLYNKMRPYVEDNYRKAQAVQELPD